MSTAQSAADREVAQPNPLRVRADDALAQLSFQYQISVTVPAAYKERSPEDFKKYVEVLERLLKYATNLKLAGIEKIEEINDSDAHSHRAENTIHVISTEFNGAVIIDVLNRLIPDEMSAIIDPMPTAVAVPQPEQMRARTRSLILGILREIFPGQVVDSIMSRVSRTAATQIHEELLLYPDIRLQIAKKFLKVRFIKSDEFKLQPLNAENTEFFVARENSKPADYTYFIRINSGPPFDVSLARRDNLMNITESHGARKYYVSKDVNDRRISTSHY